MEMPFLLRICVEIKRERGNEDEKKKTVIAGIMFIFLTVVVLTAVCGNYKRTHPISDKSEKNQSYKKQEIVKALGAVEGEKENSDNKYLTDADSKKHMAGDTVTFKASARFHQLNGIYVNGEIVEVMQETMANGTKILYQYRAGIELVRFIK